MNFSKLLLIFLGLAIWWLVPFLLHAGWPGFILIIAAIICLAVISIRFRAYPQIVTVWIPVMVFAGLSTLAAVLMVLTAIAVLLFYHPQSLFGSLSGGVFVVAAIPIAISGVVPAVILFFSIKYRPKCFPKPLSSLALLNTLALCVFIGTYQQTLLIFARDPMIVHVLDSQNRPISQVTIHYANYTMSADGGTEPEPEESGTLMTDDKGTVQLSPDCLARHVLFNLSKDGYEEIKATVVNDDVGMGDQGYRVIHVQLNGQKEEVAKTYVSNKHPIIMKLFLPTDKEAPSPERQISFASAWPSSGEIYLKLSDGTMTEATDGDLKFEVIEKVSPGEPDEHFKVTALHGASLTPYHTLRADSAEGIKNETFAFNDMMSLAPLNQFTDTLMIDWLDKFYYRSPDGRQYSRIELLGLGSYKSPYTRGPKGKIFLWTVSVR